MNFTQNQLKEKEVVFVLIGTYEHNIDGKNRLFVPAKFRAVLGGEFIFKVCRSKYPSIQLYSKAQFQKEVDEAQKLATMNAQQKAEYERDKLQKELDEERKAAMVSNLLVVLCGNKDAQPIVNSGSLY